jgi:hypothetical protein
MSTPSEPPRRLPVKQSGVGLSDYIQRLNGCEAKIEFEWSLWLYWTATPKLTASFVGGSYRCNFVLIVRNQ